MWISHLNKSNKDVYCIEILYKYDHTIESMINNSQWDFESSIILIDNKRIMRHFAQYVIESENLKV